MACPYISINLLHTAQLDRAKSNVYFNNNSSFLCKKMLSKAVRVPNEICKWLKSE